MYTIRFIVPSGLEARGMPYIYINLGLRPIAICDGISDLTYMYCVVYNAIGSDPYGMRYAPRLSAISERGMVYVFFKGFPL